MKKQKPPIDQNVDLRDYPYMPLDVVRLRDSDIARLSSGDAFRAAVLLWCTSWHQIPAGSLPNDDRLLASYAGYGRDIESWSKVRDEALHGFVLCDDGKFYHNVICEKAKEAWDRRIKRQEFVEKQREKAAKRWSHKGKRRNATACTGAHANADATAMPKSMPTNKTKQINSSYITESLPTPAQTDSFESFESREGELQRTAKRLIDRIVEYLGDAADPLINTADVYRWLTAYDDVDPERDIMSVIYGWADDNHSARKAGRGTTIRSLRMFTPEIEARMRERRGLAEPAEQKPRANGSSSGPAPWHRAFVDAVAYRHMAVANRIRALHDDGDQESADRLGEAYLGLPTRIDGVPPDLDALLAKAGLSS